MQEFDDLAEQQSVQPQAAAGTGPQRHVEGDAHESGADSRARQVLDESFGNWFKDSRAAGAPQHGRITCGKEKGVESKDQTSCLPEVIY